MTVEDYSKRSDYLSDINTRNFIDWLEFKVDSPASLRHEYYLKKKKQNWNSHCLYDAYEKYLWSYNKYCPAMGKQVSGSRFNESFKYMTELAEMFRASVRDDKVELAHNCALAMLGWGGVLPNNRERIKNMGGNVCNYFKQVQKRLNMSDVRLGNHDDIIINSGFTKLYFLLVDDLIMYDGRVGAALGLLGRMYAEEKCFEKIPEAIEFSFGSGKTSGNGQQGKNRRNPSKGRYWLPEFTGKPYRHLNDNIKASWLLKELADRTSSRFAQLPQNPPLNERLTAIQSALFMIGYDVQQM
jgi:hypothetical protein